MGAFERDAPANRAGTAMPRSELLTRTGYAAVGVVVLSFGAALLLASGLGVDPFTAVNTGLARMVGVPLGLTQLATNAVLLVAVWFWGRDQIGPGSIINMVCVGFLIGWFSELLAPVIPANPSSLMRMLLFAAGLAIFDFGCSAYMCAGVGTAPYDAVAPMLVARLGRPYRKVRAVQDLACAALAVLLRGNVGVSTVVTAFFNGPLIEHYSDRFNRKIVDRLVGGSAGRQ